MNTSKTVAVDETKKNVRPTYEMFIEPNLDSWRAGFHRSVSNCAEERECGLEPSRRLAMSAAKKIITKLIKSAL